MKIPKYIDKLIERRRRLAYELMDVCSQIDNWLENNGFDTLELSDYTHTGCMIYVEPVAAASCLRQDILNKE